MLACGCSQLLSQKGKQRAHSVFPSASSKVHTSDTFPGYKSYGDRLHHKNHHLSQTIEIRGYKFKKRGSRSFFRETEARSDLGGNVRGVQHNSTLVAHLHSELNHLYAHSVKVYINPEYLPQI